MSDESKHNTNEASQSSAPTTRRRFMEMGIKGITLLPYVAPMIETYFINDTFADGEEGSGGGSGSGSGGGDGKGKKKVSPPPGKGGGGGSGSGGSGGGGDHSGSSGY